jgi:hypothetical protein
VQDRKHLEVTADCQEGVQIPDQSFRCEERDLIVRTADLRWPLVLISQDLVFLEHGQSEEERRLQGVHSCIECNSFKLESCQEERRRKQGDRVDEYVIMQNHCNVLYMEMKTREISHILQSRDILGKAGGMPRTDSIKGRLTGRTPFVVGIMRTYLRSRERQFFARCNRSFIGTIVCTLRIVFSHSLRFRPF